ncbi:sensor histidine kinase [Cryobacterium cryoconiti]|nr:histidine kinase [Cryobacterium cryoconiti]
MRVRWAAAAAHLVDALLAEPGADRLGVLTDCISGASNAALTCAIVPLCGDSENVPETGADIRVGAARGPRARNMTGLVLSSTRRLSGRAFDGGRPFLIDGPDGDANDGVCPGEPVIRDSAVVIGPTMVVPLAGQERPVVAVTASRARGATPFTVAELAAASEFARLAGRALRLDSGYANRERRAIQRDRDRIGRDLHDQVIQRIFAAGLGVQAVGRLTEDQALRQRLMNEARALDVVMAEIRTAVFGLTAPERTGRASVRRGILDLLEELRPLFPRPPMLAFSGAIDLLVPDAMADDVHAVVREGLTNVLRHARAGETWVSVSVTARTLRVEISDDGVGLTGSTRRSGVAGLSVRAERWQGMLSLTDRRPRGARLIWTASLADLSDLSDGSVR